MGLDENNKEVKIDHVAKSTPKKVYWKHTTEDGVEHKWLARISDRTNNNSGCPFCNSNNILKPGINDLDTWCKNNEFGEVLKRQWTGITENGDSISMQDISFGSHTKLLWKCDCTKTWYARLLFRTYNKKSTCPECSLERSVELKRIRDLENSKTLREWCNENSIVGEQLLREWVGEDINGNSIDIDNITHGSTQKVMWCHTNSKGELHKWEASIHNRTSHYSMCPYCNNKSSSIPEQIIYRCFKQIYPNTINRGKRCGYEFDIIIPDLNTYIEYGSTYYHEGREQRDKEKEELCNKLGINFIQITGYNDAFTDEIWTDNKIVTYVSSNKLEASKKIVKHIFKILKLEFNKIDYNKAVQDSIEFMES